MAEKNDFVSALNSAFQVPEAGGGSGRDLPDGFPFTPASNHRVVETAEEGIPGAMVYDYTIHRRVFTIFRPWKHCERCANEIASEEVEFPPEADLECPHTNVRAYQETMNNILAGKLIKVSEREADLKDGTIVVSLCWSEPTINHKRLRQMKKDLRAGVETSE